jgi:hypothetical protein
MYIPDPIELMERIEEATIDRIEIADGVECYPCDDCGKATTLNDIVCMDPLGVSGGICGDCFDIWVKVKEKESKKIDKTVKEE